MPINGHYLNQEEIDILLKTRSSFVREATKEDKNVLKEELYKKVDEYKQKNELEAAEYMEDLLKHLEVMNLHVTSENNKEIHFVYTRLTNDKDYENKESGFIIVKR
ncbi:hypothetical protein [Domibacillus mangrovi]|uniref:Uncharacterized protein n=1 Tax=Domibacillus mangrovi TaxID=1714354 RepID=A0A1Q5NZG9_9BACI|nr:hypothetical protein [Domibacillus mangrovi]OKL35308.1 hypothetical protein BLL40_16300 [Domibacillus mangrovi]